MDAAVFKGAGQVVVTDQPPPIVPTGGALLEVDGCGMCIADGESVRGIGGPPHRPPIVLGHEIVGRLVAIGPDASGQIRALEGRRVIVDDARPCGVCPFCLRGAPRCCRSPHYGHIPFEAGSSWGGYARLLTIDRLATLHVVDEAVSVEQATFAFPLASGIEWTHRLAALAPGDTVAVVGHSRMGVASVAAAALVGPRRIAFYGQPGGTAPVSAARSLGADVLEFGDRPSEGFDVVVVVTEATAAEVEFGLGLASTMGRVILASCATEPIPVEPESIRKRGLMIRGGRGHSAASLEDAIVAVTTHTDWIEDNFFQRYDLADAETALTSMHDARDRPVGTHRVLVPRASR